ncbi:MAG: hypothetical protein IPJ98_22750 [Bryobacterales bacterium]|nr:hypothetical protein [Bryobacterales bacterium]
MMLSSRRMDVSEIWPFVTIAAVVVLGGIAFWLARRVRSGWVRIPARLLAAGTTTVSLCLLLLFASLDSACTVRGPAIWSPDGGHVALLRWDVQGAFGADAATVSVRPRDGWTSVWVFYVAGVAEMSPEVRWLGNARLEIRYWDARVYRHRCGERVEGVEIVCVKASATSS